MLEVPALFRVRVAQGSLGLDRKDEADARSPYRIHVRRGILLIAYPRTQGLAIPTDSTRVAID